MRTEHVEVESARSMWLRYDPRERVSMDMDFQERFSLIEGIISFEGWR